MKYIRITTLIITSLVCFQILSFQLLGKRCLTNQVIKNYRTYLIDRDIANGVYSSNLHFNSLQEKQLKELFNVRTLQLVEQTDALNKYRSNSSDLYIYIANAKFKNSVYATVIDAEIYHNFIANDRGKYIWILFFWIKLNKENFAMT
ncbi:hypothetical protein [Marinifilum flexuosum]|uniref:hypothetical protein n=1 Tax=Marinifilum flexuosum TaxID=1117708 RepID=UPI002495987C|nr:hypothetical protein [Marinifilum flexuosum]